VLGRFFYLQIIQGKDLKELREQNINAFEYIYPKRGRILSRDGVVLAEDRKIFSLVIDIEQKPSEESIKILSELFPEKIILSNKVLISYLSEKFIKRSIEIASILRENNINVDLYSDNGKLKKQLQYANNNNITNVIIIGEDEIKSNILTLKNMEKGTQEKLNIEEIVSKLS